MKARSFKIFFFLLLPFFSKAVSTGEIVGRITIQETKEPVAFAEIIFENSSDKITVQANEYGYFYASHLPTGKYVMRTVFNNRTFAIKAVRVYDSYASEVNMTVSNSNELGNVVELKNENPRLSSVEKNDIRITGASRMQGTQTLSELLSQQPGIDIWDGKIYVKGSSDVKFFIDGTPVMGAPVVDRIW